MAREKKRPYLEEDEGPTLVEFLNKYDTRVQQAAKLIAPPGETNEDLIWVRTPAPNAIQWTVGNQYLHNPSTFNHTRQYQIIRDFFELRCPLCNSISPEAIDCWGKSRMYLEGEVLLEWSHKHQMDVCPKCHTTRREYVEDRLFKDYNQMHAVTGMRCQPTYTHILTNRGLRRLSSLLPSVVDEDKFYKIDEDIKVFGINGWEQVSDVYYAGNVPSKNLSLSNGINHTVSHVHPMYGYSNGMWGWHKADALKVDDYIMCSVADEWIGSSEFSEEVLNNIERAELRKNSMSSFVLPRHWTTDLAAILGYLISEGSVTYEYTVKFTNGDGCTLDQFSNLCRTVFNKSAVWYAGIAVELAGAGIRDTLKALGLGYNTAHTKCVPECIWSAPKECVAAFMSAYFEGDGTVATEVNKNGRPHGKPAVACYTVSKRLALDIQQLLWNFGIDASVTSSQSRKFGTGGARFDHLAYSIRIYGENIIKFSEKIGFQSERKKKALVDCVNAINCSDMDDSRIPHLKDILNKINDIIPFKADISSATNGVRSGRFKSMSRFVLVRVLDYIKEYHKLNPDSQIDLHDLEQLEILISKNARYVRIKSIEDGPVMPMADLHVPNTHSYVANSIMNHNSGKTVTASIISSYIEHRVINFAYATDGGLPALFQHIPNQMYELTFIASSDVQSKDTVWAHFLGRRQQSPWTQRYIKWLKDMEKAAPKMSGLKTIEYTENDKEISNDHIRVTLNSANSNCFVGDTPILMSDYTRSPISNLKVGDNVIDRYGHKQEVQVAWQELAPRELVEVSLYGGTSFKVTANHRFPVWAWPRKCVCGCNGDVRPGNAYLPKHYKSGQNKSNLIYFDGEGGGHRRRLPIGYNPLTDLAAGDIKSSDFLMISRKFEEAETLATPEMARLLGYYVSEGCENRSTRKNGYILWGSEFSLNINELTTWVKDIKSICDGLGVHHNTQLRPKHSVCVTFTTGVRAREIAQWLRNNAGHYAKHKIFSEEVMRWPLALKAELIKGMFRGDGTHYLNNGIRPAISYGTASENIANQLRLILAHLGVYCGVVKHHRKAGKFNKVDTVQYYVNVGGEQTIDLANKIWGQNNRFVGLSVRKSARPRCKVDDSFIYVPVKSVKTVCNTEPVYNITVSNDHSYVVDCVGTYNSSGMAGRTRILAAVDELSRFQAADGRQSADEAYRVLENSLQTVRSDATRLHLPAYLGAMVSITSPISAEDKAMTLLKQAPDIKRMYACHYPTWLFNPFQLRENFDDAYAKDPLGAERDFGANPPAAVNPLIEDRERFRRSVIDPNIKPTAELEYYLKEDKVGNKYKAARMKRADLKSAGEADRSIVFDAGLTFDTFGGACAHGEWWDGPDGTPQWITVFDWILRIIPENYPNKYDVWFDSVVDIVRSLKAQQRIGLIEFDRWNSAALIQAIRNLGVPAEQKGTVVQDFVKFVADANLSRIRLPSPLDDEDTDSTSPDKLSAYGTVFYELERLQRSPDLRKVFNPLKGQRRGWNSDDISQCVVHCHRLVQEQVAINNTTGHNQSAESRLKAEQIGGSAWGRSTTTGVFHPRSGTRRW